MTSPVRVLVVEDNHDAADALGMLLRYLGCEVRIAHSGDTALTEASTLSPELTFIDLGMPGMDGFAIAHEVRLRASSAKPLIVALTGYACYREKALNGSFDDYLIKPVDVDVLKALVDRASRSGAMGNQ